MMSLDTVYMYIEVRIYERCKFMSLAEWPMCCDLAILVQERPINNFSVFATYLAYAKRSYKTKRHVRTDCELGTTWLYTGRAHLRANSIQ